MRVTLTRDLGTHRKGDIREVSEAVAKRLVDKGAAKKASRAGEQVQQDAVDVPQSDVD